MLVTTANVQMASSGPAGGSSNLATRRAIDNLFNALTITTYRMNATDLSPVQNFDIRCTNIRALREAGQQIPTEFRLNYNVTRNFRPSYLTTILQQYESIMTNSVFPVIDRIIQMFRFARETLDYFVKFDFMWKAFNAFYDYVYEERTGQNPELAHVPQRQRFRRFVDEVIEAGQATNLVNASSRPIFELNPALLERLRRNSIIDLLINRQLIAGVRRIHYSQNLRNTQTAGNDTETLKAMLDCLYVIRCQIAHGDLYSQDDQDFVYDCSMLLGQVLCFGLNNYLRPIVPPSP